MAKPLERDSSVDEVCDGPVLLAAGVVEVHADGWEFATAVGARSVFGCNYIRSGQ